MSVSKFKLRIVFTKIIEINPEQYPPGYSKQDIIGFEKDPETLIDSFEMSGGEGWNFEVTEVQEDDTTI